jgi:hypothetical protein
MQATIFIDKHNVSGIEIAFTASVDASAPLPQGAIGAMEKLNLERS